MSRVTKEKKERSETTAKTEKTVKMETKARTAMKEAAEMMAPMAEAVPTVRAVPTDPVEKGYERKLKQSGDPGTGLLPDHGIHADSWYS